MGTILKFVDNNQVLEKSYIDFKNNWMWHDQKLFDLENGNFITEQTTVADFKRRLLQLNEGIWDQIKALGQDTVNLVNNAIQKGEMPPSIEIIKLIERLGTEVAWPVVQRIILAILPEDFWGFVSLGIDVFSFILDVLGPFTGGATMVVSSAIDIMHGLAYIAVGMGWIGNTKHNFSFILSGLISCGFAAMPGYGNVASASLRKVIKANAGKSVGELLDSLPGKMGVKIISFLFKSVAQFGQLFSKVFNQTIKHNPIAWLFRKFGVASLAQRFLKGLDDELLQPLAKNDSFVVWAQKNGIDVSKTSKGGAKIKNTITGKLTKTTKTINGKTVSVVVAKSALEASVVKRLKNIISRRIAQEGNLNIYGVYFAETGNFLKHFEDPAANNYMGSSENQIIFRRAIHDALIQSSSIFGFSERILAELEKDEPSEIIYGSVQTQLNKYAEKMGQEPLSVDKKLGPQTYKRLLDFYSFLFDQTKESNDPSFEALNDIAFQSANILNQATDAINKKSLGLDKLEDSQDLQIEAPTESVQEQIVLKFNQFV